MKIQQFDGGLSIRTEPQFLDTNQGVVYENIDNSSGVLKPLKMPAPAGIFVKPYHTFFDHAQEWVDSDERRDYVEFQRKLYWTDRTTAPQKYDGTTQANLGIVPPPQITGISVEEPKEVRSIDVVTTTSVQTHSPLQEDTFYAVVYTASIPLTFGDYSASNALVLKMAADGTVTVVQEDVHVLDISVPVITRSDATTYRTIEFKTLEVDNPTALAQAIVFRLFQGEWRVATQYAPWSGVILVPSTGTDEVYDISSRPSLTDLLTSPPAFYNKLVPFNLKGTYQYQFTYYNSADGTESGPGLFSAEVTLPRGGKTTLSKTSLTSSDPQVDRMRLYRVGGNLTTSTLVSDSTNATGLLLDNDRDADLTGQLLISSIAFNPPTTLAFLTTAYAMLFAAEGSKLRFTPIGDPNSWPELYFLEFDLDITGIAAVSNGILVFTKYETHLVTGTGPNALSKQRLSADQGCLAFESIQVMGGAALWVSTDGICTSGGGPVQVVSKQTLGKYRVDAVASAVYDESYYVLDSGGTVTTFDFAYGKTYATQTPGVTSLALANDVLYGVKAGELQQFYSGAEATLKYKSPRFIEGSVTEQKRYNKFTVYHEGDIIIKVYIDNALVATKELSGTDSTEFKIPSEQLRGFFVQFEIEGTGTVHEIEYAVGRT